ncbi:MAG: hypothetical protein HC804_02210 [Anaerolineae bacterium]|nr:hypothetical protein [Anaerolineae bacterium]
MAAASTAWTAIQTAITTAITTVQTVVTTVATALQTFWDEHGVLVLATAERIWLAIQDYITGVWDTITALFAAFKSAFEGDWTGFGENLRIAWETAWETITTYLGNLWSIVAPILAEFVFAAINYLAEIDWAGVGTNIIQGIANGITAAAGIIADAAVSAAQAAFEAAKAFLGIDSPSKLFEEQIGHNMALGAAQGLLGGMGEIDTAMEQLFRPSIQAVGGKMGAGAGGGASHTDNSRQQRVTMINPQFVGVQNPRNLLDELEALL